MEIDTIAESDLLYQWSARKLQPVVLVYVAAVFLAFIALSFFVFHSMTAVMALAMTAVAAIVPLVPGVLQRVEYRLTAESLEKRPFEPEQAGTFESIVRLDQLSHIEPMSHGFKFYTPIDASNPLRRFWMRHVSDEFSGEVHVESADREEVRNILAEQGISFR